MHATPTSRSIRSQAGESRTPTSWIVVGSTPGSTRSIESGQRRTRPHWIIELGTNDLPNIATLDDTRNRIDTVLGRLGDGERVIWTTVLFPHFAHATQLFNEALATTAGTELVAWDAADHLADAVHPSEPGAQLLGELYCDALDRGRRTGPDLRSRGWALRPPPRPRPM
jgi:hypothetical protein